MVTKVKELKKYVEQEVDRSLPVTVLPDNSLAYKKFRIKREQDKWNLRYIKSQDIIDSFYTKSSALLAAKFYEHNNFNLYVGIKDLDRKYYYNNVDIDIYKEQIKRTQDPIKREILYNRYDLSEHRSRLFKEQIASEFKTHF
jgi:hypothetical protein